MRKIKKSLKSSLWFSTMEINYRPFLGAFAKLRKATVSFVMSVCLSVCMKQLGCGRIFMKFDIYVFKICLENSKSIKI